LKDEQTPLAGVLLNQNGNPTRLEIEWRFGQDLPEAGRSNAGRPNASIQLRSDARPNCC